MPPEVQARIDQLHADMQPLQDLYGVKSMTIEERYQDCVRRAALSLSTPARVSRSRFSLPKL